MNLNVAIQILDLALSVLRGQSNGAVQSDAALATSLTEIIRIAAQAYQDHTGQPIDPSVIKAENAI